MQNDRHVSPNGTIKPIIIQFYHLKYNTLFLHTQRKNRVSREIRQLYSQTPVCCSPSKSSHPLFSPEENAATRGHRFFCGAVAVRAGKGRKKATAKITHCNCHIKTALKCVSPKPELAEKQRRPRVNQDPEPSPGKGRGIKSCHSQASCPVTDNIEVTLRDARELIVPDFRQWS